jgi:thioredoxin-related protein
MKRILLLAVAFCTLIPLVHAQAPKPKMDNKEIHWITSFDELQEKMKQNPKKVYIDIYTDWCGWCKKMDASTFANPDLIKYMNLNYYCVKFNAERQDVIQFNGKTYQFNPQYKANMLAVELIGKDKQIGYPTGVVMVENFQNPQPLGGYLTVPQIEPILTYFGDNMYKHQPWDAYQKSYKPTWDHGMASHNTPPPGH